MRLRGRSAGLALLAAVAAWSPAVAEDRTAQRRAWLDQECGDRISPVAAEALAKTKIIDAHSHVFNLAYLPVEGILLRFRLPAPAAHAVAKILVRATDVGEIRSLPLEERGESEPVTRLASRLSEGDLQELGKYEKAIRKAVERSRLEDEGALSQPLDKRLEEIGVAMLRGPEEAAGPPNIEAGRRSLALLLELIGGATHPAEATEVRLLAATQPAEERAGVRQAIAGFLGMAALLTQREDRIALQLMREFPLVDVFVHHLMDLDTVYDSYSRLAFQQQLDRVVHLRAMSPRFRADLPFSVAFDPFRGEAAFANIRAGVAAGAVAVKFYPPSGYRPIDTVIPVKPSIFQRHFPFLYLPISARFAQRRQWTARYGDGSDALAKRIARFIAMVGPPDGDVAGLDVPIFSHHTPVGFEAMPGYGETMARPEDWRKVLEAEPKTRLVLAHSGGGDHWFHDGDWTGSFDEQAYRLCTDFENVFCDFGMSTEILTADGRRAFRRRLESLIPQCTAGSPSCAAPPFAILDKIVYGSDWHMLARDPQRTEMICSFAEAFSSPALENHVADFFGRNALRAIPRLSLARP